MSKHDDGFGHKAGPNPGPQSDFTKRPNVAGTPGIQSWGNNALNAQPSGANLMAQGAGQPGRPATGQRPMFGGGSPIFAPMPSYTPVTRGSDPRQQIPEPPQPAYDPYAPVPPQPNPPMPQQPIQETAPGLGHPSPQTPLNYPTPETRPGYQNPPQGGAPGYQNTQHPSAPGQMAAPNYQPAELGGQAYQQPRPSSVPGAEHPGSQPYPAPNGAEGAPGQAYADRSFADASFPETSAGDASFPETGAGDASFPEASFDQNFADANFTNQDFSGQGFAEAGVPQPGFDASFPEQVFPGAEPFEHQDPPGPDSYGKEQGFEPFADEAGQDYGEQVPKSDPRQQLQAFDAGYDQPPQIALGSTEPARNQSQDFYEGERLDADFLDETQILSAQSDPTKAGSTLKSRSAVMVGAALLGAIALGGVLALAYKQSGGGLGSEPPPLVQADSTPVKAAPDQPGGKQFPHKNKLIYDRLQNADEPAGEKLVPRQEDVAVPALPGSDTGGTPAAVATTDPAPPTTQAVPGAMPVAAVNDLSMPEGGPRKVRTMVVRPDGSVEAAAVPAPPAEAAQPQAAAGNPQSLAAAPPPPANAAPQETASVPAPEAKPKPPAQQTAAAAPKAAAKPKEYVVQVGSKKNQTDALASFADIQQKYPTLLGSYRPIVQKANLGAKGTWYRLRIGPVADKTAANKLCSQLKSQGLPDCLVVAQ